MIKLNTPLNLSLLAALALITVAGFALIPAGLDLPIRWGIDGHVTATMRRTWALLQMPIATALVHGIVYLVTTRGTAQTRPSTAIVLQWAIPLLTALFGLVQLLILLTGLGIAVPFFQPS